MAPIIHPVRAVCQRMANIYSAGIYSLSDGGRMLAVVLAVYMGLGLPRAILACDPCLTDPCAEGCCVSDDCTSRTCVDGSCVSVPYCQSNDCCPQDDCKLYECIDGACQATAECTSDQCCTGGDPCIPMVCIAGLCWSAGDCTSDDCCPNADPCKEVQCIDNHCTVKKECTSDACCQESPTDDPCTVNVCNTSTWTCDPPVVLCDGPAEGACCDGQECCDDGNPCTDDFCTEESQCHHVSEVTVRVVPEGATGFTYYGPIVTPIPDVATWNTLVAQLADAHNEILAINEAAVEENRDLTEAEQQRLKELNDLMKNAMDQCGALVFNYQNPSPRFFRPSEGIQILVEGPSGYVATTTHTDTLSSTASYGTDVVRLSGGNGALDQTITVMPTGNYGSASININWVCGSSTGSTTVTLSASGPFEEPLCTAETARYNAQLDDIANTRAVMLGLAVSLAAVAVLFAALGPGGIIIGGFLAINAALMYEVASNTYSTALARVQAHHAAIVAVIEECPEQQPVGGAENDTCP